MISPCDHITLSSAFSPNVLTKSKQNHFANELVMFGWTSKKGVSVRHLCGCEQCDFAVLVFCGATSGCECCVWLCGCLYLKKKNCKCNLCLAVTNRQFLVCFFSVDICRCLCISDSCVSLRVRQSIFFFVCPGVRVFACVFIRFLSMCVSVYAFACA